MQIRAILHLFVPLAALCLAGCSSKDNRITREQLLVFEEEIAAGEEGAEPIDVGRLSLREVQPATVNSGDAMLVRLTGLESDFAQSEYPVRVHPDGTIMLPLIGRVNVSGRDLAGVENAIYQAYVPDFVPRMTVFAELTAPQETTVVVVGPTTTPGVVTLPRDQRNVLYAVARAGGFLTGMAGRVTVKPVRSNRPEQDFDLTNVHDLRRALTAAPLESGDMVVVDAAPTPLIYITGLVNLPGPVSVPKDSKLSLVRAVSSAGGLLDLLSPSEATLWRQLPDGRQVRAKLNIGEIMSGKEDDIALLPGDVLDVPHTTETRLRQWAIENIRIGPFGATATYDPVADYRTRILRDDRDNNNFIRNTLLGSFNTAVQQAVLTP